MPVAWAASPPPSAGSALAVLLLCNRPRRHANTWPWAWRRRLLSVGVRGRPGLSAGDRQDQADVTQITLGCRSDAAPAAVALPTSPASPTTRPSCPGRTSSVHSANTLTTHAGTASHAWPLPWQSMPPTEERPIAITALRCRIGPFIRSRRRLWRRRPGVSAGLGLLGEARPAHAGPHPQDTQIKTDHTSRSPVLRPAVNLAPDCPARGHRVKGALRASPKAIGYRRPLTRRPLTRITAPARMTDRTRTNKHGPGRGS